MKHGNRVRPRHGVGTAHFGHGKEFATQGAMLLFGTILLVSAVKLVLAKKIGLLAMGIASAVLAIGLLWEITAFVFLVGMAGYIVYHLLTPKHRHHRRLAIHHG